MAKGTLIVVRALTDKGAVALGVQKKDELAYRQMLEEKKHKTRSEKDFLKTVSLYAPKEGHPREHRVMGFSRMSQSHKTMFYLGVKKSFFENGCSAEDFEVRFYDQ